MRWQHTGRVEVGSRWCLGAGNRGGPALASRWLALLGAARVPAAPTALLVENEPDLVDLMSIVLRRAGLTVIAVDSGSRAVATASARHVDVVVLDRVCHAGHLPIGSARCARLRDSCPGFVPLPLDGAVDGGAADAEEFGDLRFGQSDWNNADRRLTSAPAHRCGQQAETLDSLAASQQVPAEVRPRDAAAPRRRHADRGVLLVGSGQLREFRARSRRFRHTHSAGM